MVNGLLLVPPAYMSDGLHPGNHGARELAINLNAQMGFARVRFKVVRCPTLTLEVSGVEPHGWFDVYWGRPTTMATVLTPELSDTSSVRCHGRSLMLSAYGKVSTRADSTGGPTTVVVPQVDKFDGCHSVRAREAQP